MRQLRLQLGKAKIPVDVVVNAIRADLQDDPFA